MAFIRLLNIFTPKMKCIIMQRNIICTMAFPEIVIFSPRYVFDLDYYKEELAEVVSGSF